MEFIDAYKKSREQYPDSLLIFRIGGSCMAFDRDAAIASRVIGLPVRLTIAGSWVARSVRFSREHCDEFIVRLGADDDVSNIAFVYPPNPSIRAGVTCGGEKVT